MTEEKANELVLVLNEKFSEELKKEMQDTKAISDSALELATTIPGIVEFRRRGDVENNESVLQVIPYVIIFDKDKKVALYRRTSEGGESRLAHKDSIGFGGHINKSDAELLLAMRVKTHDPNLSIVKACVQRELTEELNWTSVPTGCAPNIAIYDNSNPVSRVHVGIIQLAFVTEFPTAKESSIGEVIPMTIEEIKANKDNNESWTNIVLEFIEPILDKSIDLIQNNTVQQDNTNIGKSEHNGTLMGEMPKKTDSSVTGKTY